MKKFKSVLLIPVMIFLFVGFPIAASAVTTSGEESYASTVTLDTVTLPEHSSYVSSKYFGVINISVVDANIAAATSDSQGHVVITSVGAGTTTVYFWYKNSVLDDWVKATLPVTVSTTATSITTVDSTGLVFPESSVSITKSSTYTVSGIVNNGIAVTASSLLWVTPSNSVITVDASTGKVSANSTGTAQLYALDPATNNTANIKITVQ